MLVYPVVCRWCQRMARQQPGPAVMESPSGMIRTGVAAEKACSVTVSVSAAASAAMTANRTGFRGMVVTSVAGGSDPAGQVAARDVVTAALKLYGCRDAPMLRAVSVGLKASHWVRSLVQVSPGTSSPCVAPVARAALTRLCMPATWYPMLAQVPPSRRQVHAA